MKVSILTIFTFLCFNSFGQASQLNELLNKYVIRDFLWNKYQPKFIQESQELIVPDFINLDTLYVIKGHDIDSITMTDSRQGNVRINIYGKVIKYQLCKELEICNNRYFDRLYIVTSLTESIFIPLLLKTHDGEPILKNNIRNKFKKSLKQISNTTIKENYRVKTQPNIKYKKNRIIRYVGNDIYEYKQINVRVKAIKNVQKLEIHNTTSSLQKFKAVSFTLYINTNDNTSTFYNDGPDFSNEIKKSLKNVAPGTTLTFDNIKVSTDDGIRTIDGMSIYVK